MDYLIKFKAIVVVSLMLYLLLTGCRENRPTENSYNGSDQVDSISSQRFPILIEGGAKAVYRFGKMTPRGLKFFYDTVDYKSDGILLPESLQSTFLSPLSISTLERDSVPCVIAVSLPGFWEETIFGKIDNNGRLHVNYKFKEIQLLATNDVVFKAGEWSGIFQNDSLEVQIVAVLSETKIGGHLAGKGKMLILDRNKLMEEQEIFLVYNKRQIITP